MKKIYVLLVVGASFMMSACSDFLDREPLTTPNSETFLSNASAVNNYINGLYIALPSFGTTSKETLMRYCPKSGGMSQVPSCC